MIALLLDLSNIFGGFLLAIGLLARLPSIGDNLAAAARKLGPLGWIVGVIALICGGYYLIVHLTSGPGVLHFEIVGIITGVLLLWDRLGLARKTGQDVPDSRSTGSGLIVAIFGVIAMIVGFQGLFTPN
ncbi:hypothetical protein [Phenylobacterium sp.]|uniref:hypothetical protein n=1 Tax=Phenylobacterium sp. TaxID=1871053 RepID=UPI002731E54C|nr:hypothetical protein [Phenylobacterium sp.]MDP1616415.1 hypothetical protein [Phenylobacterium sp.]MDP1986074.1 hypothetical protein [Phenylobacterium sp.]